MKRSEQSGEQGYIIVLFLILMVLSLVVIGGSLKVSSANLRTTDAATVRTERYFVAESGLHRGLSWLRSNSKSILKPFSKEEFYSKFVKTAPTVGANDNGDFPVPTKIKVRGTSDSVILSNSSEFGTASFPDTSHIATGASFDPEGQFAGSELGDAQVRVTLVDAVPLDPSKDAPPLASPDTDFYPVYRVDAMTGTDRGAHLYGYITGSLYYVDTIGFYGRDFVNVNQDCMSAKFTGPNAGPTNAKCPVGSNAAINVANNAEIYGSARSNGVVGGSGKVCADYPSCASEGTTCEGADCNVPGLPTYQSWNSYCPPTNGPYPARTAAANQNLQLNTAGCYSSMTINNRGSYTLTNTTAPYYIDTLNISGGNPQTQLRIAPSDPNGTVTLYVRNIVTNNLNGNQAINTTARPSQFRIIYLGTADLTLNGNSNISMALTAPYAGVTVQGSADFRGGIIAKNLTFNGSARIMYDETLGGATLSDVMFKMRQVEEYYR